MEELPLKPQIRKETLQQVQSLSWDEQIYLSEIYLPKAIESLKKTDSVGRQGPPKEGQIKGIYFCLHDDVTDLCLAGSLYFDEEDWAANADYYPDEINLSDQIRNLRVHLDDLLDDVLDNQYIEFLVYSYLVYACFFIFPTLNVGKFFTEVGVAIGYSDGDEIGVGSFKDGLFTPDITDIQTIGYSKPSSVVPVIVSDFLPRGPLWEYTYRPFLSQKGLMDSFGFDGEGGAQKISQMFQKDIYINTCHLCGHIKKTPRARLCLACGNFADLPTP